MIRIAANADRLAIGRVYCAAWKAAYRGTAPQTFLDALTDENCAPAQSDVVGGRVCELDGQIVGVVSYGTCREACSVRVGEIRSIYVLPAYWNRGVGRALFGAAADELRERGYTGFYLWVLWENARVRRFYERMGMTRSTLLEEVKYVRKL